MDKDDFIGFSLGAVHFVMRRAPFFAAIHRGDAEGLVNPPGIVPAANDTAVLSTFIDGFLCFNNREIPLFRFDDLLSRIFHITEPGHLRSTLVARLDSFSPSSAEAFRSLIRTCLPGADEEYLAFGISGDGSLRSIPWRELRPVPHGIRQFLWNKGIIACRFGAQDQIEYLLDPADICFPYLEVHEAIP